MFRHKVYAAIAVVGLLAGCSKGSKESEKIVEGQEVSKNPLTAMSQLAQAGSEMEKLQKELDEMKPVDPVSFKELMPFLPEAPAGWQAEKARGESSQMGEWKFSHAERQYTSGEKSMQVEVADWAYTKALYAPFFLTAAFSQETSEGYNKGIKIGEDPGREEFQHEGKNGTLTLLVGKRFMVTVKGNGVEAAELRQWLDKIDTAGLRAKAK